MTGKARMSEAVRLLKEKYPEAVCSLSYDGEPWRLMVMGRLSAQCTDARVNIVCRDLFSRFPTPEALAEADTAEVGGLIRSCGLYNTKAADIIAECRMLVCEYGGVLPDNMENLLKFPGIGRKIANLLLGDIYGKGGVVTDTHCIRICGRLGFYPEEMRDPQKVEKLLTPLIPTEEQSNFCHRLVLFGRDTCTARSPDCGICPLSEICRHNKTNTRKA